MSPKGTNGGKCSVKGCMKVSRTKGLCDMYYTRIQRNGSLETKYKRSEIKTDKYIAFNYENEPKRHGLCSSHLMNTKELKSPFIAKTVKLCGVKDCDKIHFGNGLCCRHYYQWRAVVRDNKLHKFVELRGWEDIDNKQ